ncbi:MAG: hypothetical protein NZT92_04545 [Abditibacteriales bacterium]|nr:hypothetical protein [Abditibacteriales bacterium]MDW8365207.1 hypothetical protein [Abditibacteriales bacterium]
MATKITITQKLQLPPSEWMEAYEEFLSNCYRIGFLKYNELIGEEILELFFRRSGLAEAMKIQPDGLTLEQRKHLRKLDKQLREMTPLLDSPYFAERARKLGYPRSHWWWYLGEAKTDGKRRGRKGKQVGTANSRNGGRS